jgi:hypothetical protein
MATNHGRPCEIDFLFYFPDKENIKFNTIEWYNGADFAPEYLYHIGVQQEITEKEVTA